MTLQCFKSHFNLILLFSSPIPIALLASLSSKAEKEKTFLSFPALLARSSECECLLLTLFLALCRNPSVRFEISEIKSRRRLFLLLGEEIRKENSRAVLSFVFRLQWRRQSSEYIWLDYEVIFNPFHSAHILLSFVAATRATPTSLWCSKIAAVLLKLKALVGVESHSGSNNVIASIAANEWLAGWEALLTVCRRSLRQKCVGFDQLRLRTKVSV